MRSAADKLSCLDSFRKLLTEIGNALGYVRMVRTAGMRQGANAVQFLPSVKREDVASFQAHASAGAVRGVQQATAKSDGETAAATASDDCGLSSDVLEAASVLDKTMENLLDGFGDETNYLQLLVEVSRLTQDPG